MPMTKAPVNQRTNRHLRSARKVRVLQPHLPNFKLTLRPLCRWAFPLEFQQRAAASRSTPGRVELSRGASSDRCPRLSTIPTGQHGGGEKS